MEFIILIGLVIVGLLVWYNWNQKSMKSAEPKKEETEAPYKVESAPAVVVENTVVTTVVEEPKVEAAPAAPVKKTATKPAAKKTAAKKTAAKKKSA